MCRIRLSLLLALPAFGVFGQTDTPFDKEHFPDREGLQAALDAIKEGNGFFEFGGDRFRLAIPLYEKACAFNPDNAELNMKLGLCHLNGRHRHLSLPYFKRVLRLDPAFPRAQYLLGYAYQLSGQWNEAIKAFEAHKEANRFTPDVEVFFNEADRHIAECRNGAALSAATNGTQVENLGPLINSEFADYGLLFSEDGNTVYFTSRRPNTTGGRMNRATNEFFEDVYVSTRTNGSWSEPRPVEGPLNTAGNDATVSLFNNGASMLIYRDEKGAGDLWVSERSGDTWTAPRPLGANVNSKYNESSACVSADGRWLYFVSDRPEEGIGGQDIYRCGLDATTNEWGPAQNLGPDVNTPFDEEGVYIGPDHTLYFSSKGHTCIGGFDVFRTRENDGRWSKPENLGWPVNSPDDDLFYSQAPDGSAYLSSVRSGGWGDDDLFRVVAPPAPRPEPVLVANASNAAPVAGDLCQVRGKIMSLKMLAGMEAQIDVVDLEDPSISFRFHSNAKGEFLAALPPGRTYSVQFTANGYLLHSETITTGEAGGTLPHLELTMKPLDEGIAERLNNLFFAKDRAVLESKSLAELGQLIASLKQNPEVRLEIAGHTDADGTAAHNQELSEARAQAVVDHLVTNGVDPDRLIAKGYGAAQPVAPNDTEANKARNRRTEMRVLGKE